MLLCELLRANQPAGQAELLQQLLTCLHAVFELLQDVGLLMDHALERVGLTPKQGLLLGKQYLAQLLQAGERGLYGGLEKAFERVCIHPVSVVCPVTEGPVRPRSSAACPPPGPG